MKSIGFYARAPLRISLAGGGTDIQAFYQSNIGRVLNIAIAKYVYSKITTNDNLSVCFFSLDTRLEAKFDIESLKVFLKTNHISNTSLPLHVATYKYVVDNFCNGRMFSVDLLTYSEAMPSSGLGGSSTLVVSMLKCYDCFLNLGLDAGEIANCAYYIERTMCNISGGRQDYYPASFGGANYIKFDGKSISLTPLNLDPSLIVILETTVVLHFTGISRNSSNIIDNQLESIYSSESVKALTKMSSSVDVLKTALLQGDIEKVASIIHEGWKLKLSTSELIMPNSIKSLIDNIFKQGALSCKLSGAGGGGYMFIMAKSADAYTIKNTLTSFGRETEFLRIAQQGAVSWKN